VRAENISYLENAAAYTLLHNGADLGTVQLHVPGEHNIVNSLGAACLSIELGLDPQDIIKGLDAYKGVRRRFEIKGTINDILIVDDYAHHPTEVKATLQAAKAGWDRRIVSIFQPHLFTRTRDFFMEFAHAFLASDVLIVTEIYPAREEPIEGITGALVAEAAEKAGHTDVTFLPDLDDLNRTLDAVAQPGDMILTMGAGTIWRYSDLYYSHLKKLDAAA
jgi:UDP-N-acetylmuramate--alanine ligase